MSKVKGKKRIFMWSFLAVQAVFVIWVVGGLLTTVNGTAEEAGKAIGIGIVALIWILVDGILAIGRWVVLNSRGQHRTSETT